MELPNKQRPQKCLSTAHLDRNLCDAVHHDGHPNFFLLLCQVWELTASRSSQSHSSVTTADRSAHSILSPPCLQGLSLCPRLLTLPSGATAQPQQASFRALQHAGGQTTQQSLPSQSMARGSSFLVWGTGLEAGSAGDRLSFFPPMELLNGHLLLKVTCLKLELCVCVDEYIHV